MIRSVKMRQRRPMRIRPPGPHKYRLHIFMFLQIHPERLFHRQRIACEIEAVGGYGGIDKLVDFGEWVRGDDVYGLEFGGDFGGVWVGGEGGEQNN